MPDNIKYLYEMGKYLEKKSYFKKKKKKNSVPDRCKGRPGINVTY